MLKPHPDRPIEQLSLRQLKARACHALRRGSGSECVQEVRTILDHIERRHRPGRPQLRVVAGQEG